jgi:hypothetical protein
MQIYAPTRRELTTREMVTFIIVLPIVLLFAGVVVLGGRGEPDGRAFAVASKAASELERSEFEYVGPGIFEVQDAVDRAGGDPGEVNEIGSERYQVFDGETVACLVVRSTEPPLYGDQIAKVSAHAKRGEC